VPPGRYLESSVRFGNDLLQSPLLATEYWGFNMDDPTVGGAQNLKLRQAIALTIDKKDIVQKLYGDVRRPATGWAPPGLPGYQLTLNSGDRNVEQAKELMREWGKTPPQIKISFNTGAGHEDKASIIQQNLKEIGIDAVINGVPQADYGKAIATGKLQFFRGIWNADYPSYDNFIAPLFTSPPTGDSNYFNYSNPTIDSEVSQARAEPDATKRNQIYKTTERQMLNDQPVVPIDWSAAGIVAKSTLSDVIADPLGYVDYSEAAVLRTS
jgi:oligopeptide transport system substrate-binding protein